MTILRPCKMCLYILCNFVKPQNIVSSSWYYCVYIHRIYFHSIVKCFLDCFKINSFPINRLLDYSYLKWDIANKHSNIKIFLCISTVWFFLCNSLLFNINGTSEVNIVYLSWMFVKISYTWLRTAHNIKKKKTHSTCFHSFRPLNSEKKIN